jgi:hypothetical protein
MRAKEFSRKCVDVFEESTIELLRLLLENNYPVEYIEELVNKNIFTLGWSDSTPILDGRFWLEAKIKEKYNGNKFLEIEVLDPTKQTRFTVANAKFEIKKGWLFQKHLEAAMISVFSQYQRQGIATAIYQYVRKLGNTIKPSSVQLAPGRAMWQSFKKNRSIDESNTQYKEIEFLCVNPAFPEATDPQLQKKMYHGLKNIPGVIPLLQDQSDYSDGQASLTAIYKDRAQRTAILQLAKQLGISIDLEQAVSDDYVDRAVRGEHEGQIVDEVVLMPGITKAAAEMPGDEWLNQPIARYPKFKPLFNYAGNSIYQQHVNGTNYYAVVKDGQITAVMTTEPYWLTEQLHGEQVVGITAADTNQLKMVDLYHLMLLKGKVLVSDYIQSPGGQRVWQRLSTMPGIRVRAWDHRQRKYIRTPITDVYVDPEDDKQMAEKSRMQHVLLIGTRR